MADNTIEMNQDTGTTFSQHRIDRWGAVASSLCAIHCVLCSVLPVTLGALGLGFLLSHSVEWLLILCAIGFASIALRLGWQQHRSLVVAGLFGIGILGLMTSRGVEMSSDHHGHHDVAHDEGEHHSDWKEDEHHGHGEEAAVLHQEAHSSAHHEEESSHGIGAFIGILGGVFLLLGHILNIKLTRDTEEECCA